jgi:hypothetical protein
VARVFKSGVELATQMTKFIAAMDKALWQQGLYTLAVIQFKATHKYMEHGAWTGDYWASSRKDPANPPPGPLKWRSKRLRKAVKIAPPAGKGSTFFEGSVYVDTDEAPYGYQHEYGVVSWNPSASRGVIQHRQLKLEWFTGKANSGRRISGYRPFVWLLPARPFLAPAAKEHEHDLAVYSARRINELIRRHFS